MLFVKFLGKDSLMVRTRLPVRGRTPRLMRLRLGFALAALSLTLGGNAIATAQQAHPALQGRLFQNSDGALYVYKDGAKYLVDLAALPDEDINAIPDGRPNGQPVQRVDLLFAQSVTNATPGPAPDETPAFDLKTALISLSDVPAGWKLHSPTIVGGSACYMTTKCIGGITACKDVVPPADGVDDRQLVALVPSDYNLFDGGEVVDEVVRFFPGAAKIHVDSLASGIHDCPSYNASAVLWDGPILGDQTIRFATVGDRINGDNYAAGIIVRVGDIVTEVSSQRSHGSGADHVLLEHAAERATAHLQAAMH
jgi:hypothetical protein